MQPKWILYSFTAVGMLIALLTNIINDATTTATFPPWVMTVINIGMPSLVLLRRYLGDAAAGLGQPPITLLPPSTEAKVESLVAQKQAVATELAVVKKDAA